MPVMLHRKDEHLWLDQTLKRPTVLLSLLKPYPEAQMVLYPVSRAVNSPGNDSKEHKVYTILTTRPNRLLAPIHICRVV
jgi:putative SOS response-associated peptidase YedK